MKEAAGGTFGRACGVGFVARQGVPLMPMIPVGAAWRWLRAVCRMHAVRLPPHEGLPRGLLLISIYAPLQTLQQAVERMKLVEALGEVTHILDLQEPVLMLGDYNGSVCPARDFLGESGTRREACPLLARLLGPGGAWVDVLAATAGDILPWTFQLLDREGKLSASRIDLVLANHAAMALVQRAEVLTWIRDGGHSPVVVNLSFSGKVSICWKSPRPKPPDLMLLSSIELGRSNDWARTMQEWLSSSESRQVLAVDARWTAQTLSTVMMTALTKLVDLAGGWQQRPP